MGTVEKLQYILFLVWVVMSYRFEESYGSSVGNEGQKSSISSSRNYTGVYFDPVDFMRYNGQEQTLDESGLAALVIKIHTKFDKLMIPFHIPPTQAQASSNILLPETVARENARQGVATLHKSHHGFIQLIVLCKVHNWKNLKHIQTQIQQLREVTNSANSIFPSTVSSVILEIGNGTIEAYQNYAMFRQFFYYQNGTYQPSGVKFGLRMNIETSASTLEKRWKDNLQDDPDTVYISEYASGDISGSSGISYADTLKKHFGQYQKLVRSLRNITEIALMATWPDTSVRARGKYSELVGFWDGMTDWAVGSKTKVIFVQAFDTPLAHETRMMTNGWWRLIPDSGNLHPSQFIFEDKLSLTDIDNDKESLYSKMVWLREESIFSRDNTGVVFNPNVLMSRIGKPNPYSNSSLKVLVQQISTKFSKILISMTGVSNEDMYRTLSITETVAQLDLNQSKTIDLFMTFNESTVSVAAKVAQEANELFPGVVKQMIYTPSRFQKNELVGTMLKIAGTPSGLKSFDYGVQLDGTVCLDSENFNDSLKLTRDIINSVSSRAKSVHIYANINYGQTLMGVDRMLPTYTAVLRKCKVEMENYFLVWNESITVTFGTEWPLPVEADLWERMEFVKFWEQMNEFALSTNTTVIFSSAFDDPNAATHGWWKLQENDTYPETVTDFLFEDKKQAALRLADEEISKKADPSTPASILEVSAITFPILLIVFILFAICYYERRQKLNYLTMEEIASFFNGGDPGLEGVQEPYKTSQFELSRKYFTVDETSLLGSGAFGKVCLGSVSKNGELEKEVAVKMTKVPCPRTALRALLFEIKILAYLGAHPHIVELVGAYTAELKKGRAFVFLELCSLGSLESYLRKQKPDVETENAGDGDSLESINECASVCKGNELDGTILQDMYRWSGEIAEGMEFIASKHIVHLDIASRNILLTMAKRAKITDFGLSRRMYDYQTYVKKEQAPLPWRWLAPESLRKSEFTEKSDVWGFGVLLWEIYTLGDEPYPGLSFDFNFASKLENGLRLDEPIYSHNDMYSLMLRCWATNPERRPAFSELTQCLRQAQPHHSTNQVPIDDKDLDASENNRSQIYTVDHEFGKHLTNPQVQKNKSCKFCGEAATGIAVNGSKLRHFWVLVSVLLMLSLMGILIMAVISNNGYEGDMDKQKSSPQQKTSLLYNSTAELDERKPFPKEYRTIATTEHSVIANDKLGNDESSSIENPHMRWTSSRYPKDKALGQKLFNLIDQKDLKSVAVLLQFDADVEQRNEGMETPIIRAAKMNDKAVGLKFMKLLIDHGANVHARDNINRTFLHVLVSHGTTLTSSQFHDIVEYLISKNQSISNLFGMRGWLNDQILFHISIKNLMIEKHTLSLLHKNRVDFNVLSPVNGNNVIPYATAIIRNGTIELLSDLISEFGVDWRHLNNDGQNTLHVAAEYGSVDGLKYLLKLGLDPNAQDKYGNTPLHQAVLLGKKNILEIVQLLIANGAKVNIGNHNRNSPLDAAKRRNSITDRNKLVVLLYNRTLAEQGPHVLGRKLLDVVVAGDAKRVKDLVEFGADINIRNDYMETPLIRSTYCTNDVCLRIVKYLIESGANVYARDGDNGTFLHNLVTSRANMLTASQFHDISSFLISKNMSELFNMPAFSFGATPLHLAVKNIVEVENQTLLLLQRNGVNFNILGNNGDSVLEWAIEERKSVKLLSMLVSLGTNWKQIDKFNRGLLHVAAEEGHAEGLKYFLSLGLNVNAIDAFGDTPLHRVVLYGKNNILEIIRILITNGANALITNTNGRNAFEEAVERKDLPNKQDVLQLLTESEENAIQNSSNQIGFTVPKPTSNMTDISNQVHNSTVKLFAAIELRDDASIKTLVENGADVNEKNLNPDSALHRAATSTNKTFAIETIKFLIEHGANASSRDGEDYTFLHILVDDGSSLTHTQFHDIAEFLISKRLAHIFDVPGKFNKSFVIPASPSWKYSSANNTALQLAIKNVEIRPETLSLLQRAGVDFSAVNGNGDSILHFAMMGNKSVEFMSELIALGADHKHLDSRSRSLLHTATAVGKIHQIKYILDLGLDINGVDQDGLTPLHWVLKFPNKNTLANVQFLVENGASVKVIDKYGRAPIYFAVSHDDFEDKDEIIQLLRDNH